MNILRWACCSAVLLAGGAAHGAYEVVAMTGDASPDGNGTLYGFRTPSLNDSGEVAFVASVGGNSDENSGVFRAGPTPGSLTLIVREGQADLDGVGVFPELFSYGVENGYTPLINDNGQVAFSVYSQTLGETGIFRGSGPGTLTSIVRSGQASPDGNGLFAPTISTFAFNDAGQVAFYASMYDTNNAPYDNTVIGLGDGGTPVLLAREQEILPLEPNLNPAGYPVLNESGQAAFPTYDGIHTTGGGGSSLLPGVGTGDLLINDLGQVGYKTGAGLTAQYWVDSTLIASSGQAPPDGNGTMNIDSNTFGMNNQGQLSMWAFNTDAGTKDEMLLRGDDDGSLTQIARTGDLFPTGGDTFYSFSSFIGVSPGFSAAINNAGQMAFIAAGNTDTGIFFYDDVLGLVEVVRTGDTLLGATVTGFSFTNGTNNQGSEMGNEASGLNDAGQVAFSFSLDNGTSGIAIWSYTAPLTGDLNGDGFVGQDDLNIVLGAWGTNVTPGDPLAGDPSGDGFVGQDDLNDVLAGWGQGTPPSFTVVPEPGSIMVLALGVLMVYRRGKTGREEVHV